MAVQGAVHPRRRIDCHMHYFASAFADELLGGVRATIRGNVPIRAVSSARAGWRDLGDLRRVLDLTDVRLGVILPTQTVLDFLRGVGPEATLAYNRSLSEDLAEDERFLGAATVDPLGGPNEMARLDQALQLPKLGAIGLVASYDGVALDDPMFEPIFELAQQHDVPVMVHPSGVSPSWKQTLRLDNNVLEAGLGFLLDDALCILRMALNGTFDRFPDVRFMFCQLGGFAPACCARWDFHCRQRRLISEATGQPMPAWASRHLTEYLSRVWLDTHSQDRHILRLVIDQVGDQGIVLGGDYPLTVPEDGVLHVMSEVKALGLPAESVTNIERANAARLLRLA
jgi:predicted TIM-barrel fold metal-dependent hydrolase